jgi:hypothetical protein
MSNLLNRKNARPRRIQPELLHWAAAEIATATGRYRPGGLRVDWRKLEYDDQAQLVKYVEAAAAGGGWNLDRLDAKGREHFEQLAEKACNAERGAVFERTRETMKLKRDLGEVVREAKKPRRRVTLEEAGSITLRKQWVYDFVRDGVLWPSHIGLLVYLLATFENGGTPVEAPGITFDGGTLTIDTGRAAIPPDLGDSYADWKDLLRHLAQNRFVELSEEGRAWKISPGSRLRKATIRAAA